MNTGQSFYKYNHTLVRQCLWLWTFLGKFEKIQAIDGLQGNSANAKFTIVEGYNKDETIRTRLFAKFQINDKGDDMLVDNISGYALNVLLEKNKYKEWFMEYLFSCLTIINDKNFPLKELLPKYEKPDNCHNPLHRNIALCSLLMDRPVVKTKVSFYKLIKGKGNLSALLLIKGKNNEINTLGPMLQRLFDAMRYVGTQYGFTHNDAHLGNVLVQDKADGMNLVLIDYGRVVFDLTVMKKEDAEIMNQMFSERIKYEIYKHYNYCCNPEYPEDYLSFIESTSNRNSIGLWEIIKMKSDTISDNIMFLKKQLYMFDIMVISMNILIVLRKLNQLHHLDDYVSLYKQEDRFYVEVMQPTDIIDKLIKDDIKGNSFHNTLLPGIYWFSVFVEFLIGLIVIREEKKKRSSSSSTEKEDIFVTLLAKFVGLLDHVNEQDEDQPEYLLVDLTGLKTIGIMHTYFQLLNMPKNYWDIFAMVLDERKEDLKYLQRTFWTYKVSQTGGKPKSVKFPKRKTKFSFKTTKIEKDSLSKYKNYQGEYMMGGDNSRQTASSKYYNTNEASLKNLLNVSSKTISTSKTKSFKTAREQFEDFNEFGKDITKEDIKRGLEELKKRHKKRKL
jgi:hypothetical protein